MSLFAETYFVFLNMQAGIVSWNMSIHDRISSTAFTSICQDASCIAAYDNGSAEYAYMIRSDTDPSGWTRNPRALSLFMSFHASKLNGNPQYITEFEGETVRLAEFPLKPSRFSCVFAFKSLDDCERAHTRFGWPREEIRSCKLALWPHTRTARLSMDIVSILLPTTNGIDSDQRRDLWRLYWSGGSVRDIKSPALSANDDVQRSILKGDIWENLIEGQLIVDRESRY